MPLSLIGEVIDKLKEAKCYESRLKVLSQETTLVLE